MAVKKNLFAILLLALIVFKAFSAAIHIHIHHEHENHDDPCELCEQAIYNQFLEFSSPVEFQIYKIKDIPVFHQQESPYESIMVSTLLDSTLLVRPPPSLP